MKIFRRVAPLLLALSLLPSAACAEPPKPLLWKVSDGDNSLYLLGSFHLLKPDDYPLAASTEAAYADAERFVFELAPGEANSPTLPQRFQQAALRSDGKTLQQALPPALWTQLNAHLVERGIPATNLQSLDTWFVGIFLAVFEMQTLGLDPTHGLDKHFIDRAVAAGLPATGLETGDQQIAMFENMTAEEQLGSLEDTLGEVADLKARIETMHRLWRSGDAAGLEKETMDEMRTKYPGVYAALVRDRNVAWLPVLRGMLDDSHEDDALVVVGSMHLLGSDGLVELLRAKGYTVERL